MALYVMRKWEDLRQKAEVVVPRLRRLRLALEESANKFSQSEMMQLRNVEDNISDWAGMFARLSALSVELQGCSRASAIAVALVALKALRVCNRCLDVALEELLRRQSFSSRALLFQSCLSGFVALYAFRRTILEHISAASLASSGERGAAEIGVLEEGAEWYLQLFRNLKRLPAVFWCSTAATGLVALQAAQGASVRTLRLVSRSTIGGVLLQVLGFLLVGLAYHATTLSEEETRQLRLRTQRVLSEFRRRTGKASSDALAALVGVPPDGNAAGSSTGDAATALGSTTPGTAMASEVETLQRGSPELMSSQGAGSLERFDSALSSIAEGDADGNGARQGDVR
eukprot:TRINITY_DN26323_c0_g1_i2.p1 TRINITY_DN26323_c0_g1~~TRINITY_DN26323_c0_g1_i2.p1  ORF type:complete len:343 (+),score=83.90 TRINITY_DN26323_c0_g1_i2:93-1121(+)